MEQHITLVLTERCNLNCSYCYETNKTKRSLDYTTIVNFLSTILNCDDGYDLSIIELFGGEPFLEFELIKQISVYLRNNEFKKRWYLFAVTNGTLVHGDIKEWLIKNKDIIGCGLSFDGDEKSQNINRSNSFKMVDLDFFVNNYPKQWVKMTISLETLGFLAHNVIFLHSKGFDVHCNLAYGIDWSNKENIDLLSNQLEELIQYYLINPSIKPCSFLDGDILISNDDSNVVHRWCGVCSNSMKVLGVDGNLYPCQLLMPTSGISIENKMPIIPEYVPRVNYGKECSNCILLQHCPNCYSSNFVNNGNPFIKDKGFCELQKVIFKKKAIFAAKKWERKLVKMDEKKEKVFLRSILSILNM